ncbi:MAG: glutamyl-tRNA reductase, partial [Actinomycetota bacterium]|nr:glutamyl-tRNA reductase [Actinomycetota bacterium]
MPLLVVGLNYRSAPIDLLERASISQERLPEALHSLAGYEHVVECVVLSTCNRVEAYAWVSALHGGAHDLRTFLAEFSDLAPEDLIDRLYTYRDGDAARHLFRVAAGIDSMLLGEAEILGQVRRSFRAAQGEETAGRALDPLFRRALRVGKRARTAASIQQDHVSTSSAVVEVARESFPRTALTGAGVAIVGAGDIGCSMAQAVRRAGVEDLVVVNRSEDRGRDLAHRYGATFRPMEELEAVAAAADLLVCATSARQPVVDRLLLERAMGRRGGRPLLVVDVGMPRNVDVNAHGVPGVSIRDLSDLKSLFDVETSTGVEDMSKIQEMVSRELDDYQDWLRESEV